MSQLCEDVISKLNMKECEFVTASPDRPNIYYEVRPRTTIDEDFAPFVSALQSRRNKADRIMGFEPTAFSWLLVCYIKQGHQGKQKHEFHATLHTTVDTQWTSSIATATISSYKGGLSSISFHLLVPSIASGALKQ